MTLVEREHDIWDKSDPRNKHSNGDAGMLRGGDRGIPAKKALAPGYPTACDGHVGTTEENYSRLARRYEGNPVGFVAELSKKNQERKLMHEILTSAGIPSQTTDGRDLCLLARVAVAAYELTP